MFEHKSYQSRNIAVQLLKYMSEIWDRQTLRKEADKLSIILPLVIYHGKQTWHMGQSLGDVIKGFDTLTADMTHYVPDFNYLLRLGLFFSLRSFTVEPRSLRQFVPYWIVNGLIVVALSVSLYFNLLLTVFVLTLLIVKTSHYTQFAFSAERKTQQAVKNKKEPSWLLNLMRRRHIKVNYIICYDLKFFLHPFRTMLTFLAALIFFIIFATLFSSQPFLVDSIKAINSQVLVRWATLFAVFTAILNLSGTKEREVTLFPLRRIERWTLIHVYRHMKIILFSMIAVLIVLTITYFSYVIYNQLNESGTSVDHINYLRFVLTGIPSYLPALIYALGVYHLIMMLHHLFLLLIRDMKFHLSSKFNKQSQMIFSYVVVLPFFLINSNVNAHFFNGTTNVLYAGLVIVVSLFIDYLAKRKLEVVTS